MSTSILGQKDKFPSVTNNDAKKNIHGSKSENIANNVQKNTQEQNITNSAKKNNQEYKSQNIVSNAQGNAQSNIQEYDSQTIVDKDTKKSSNSHKNRSIVKFTSNKFVSDQLNNQNNESSEFESFLTESPLLGIKEGDLIEGIVVSITSEDVFIDVNLKSEGRVPLREFKIIDDEDVQVGDKVKVCVEKIEGRSGTVVLSREKAIRDEAWIRLEENAKNKDIIDGVIFNSTRGGCVVDVGGIVAFLPSSHIDLKPVRDLHVIIGKKFQFIILKMDKSKGNVVVSRRAVLEQSNAAARKEYLKTLHVGMVLEGVVKSMTTYGVFVGVCESDEIGIVDGLLHVTDISWSRVGHPSAVFTCGQKIKVKIIKVDHEAGRISLGSKQLHGNPWENIESLCPVGSIQRGIISSIEDYGAFVELESGVEGLVHVSEISWIKSNLPITKLVTRGQEVNVKVLSIDTAKNRMSLSMKYCTENPWQLFAEENSLGTLVTGKVKTIVDFGIFINLLPESDNSSVCMDGLIHLSDISWSNPEEKIKEYKPGMEVTAKVLRINSARGRVCLGIKQCEYDPFSDFLRSTNIGEFITTVVEKIEDGGILVNVGNGAGSVSIDKEYIPENTRYAIGERVEAEVLAVGSYDLLLSIKH